MIKTLNFFNINFNSNENKLLFSLRMKKQFAVTDKFEANELSIFTFKKHAERGFTLMLVYRKQFMQKQDFFQML